MKTIKTLLLLFFSLLSINVFSVHIVGYDMSLVHTTGDNYKVLLRMYRDSTIAGPVLPLSVNFKTYVKGTNANANLNFTVVRTKTYFQTFNPADCVPVDAIHALQVGEYEYVINATQTLALNNSAGYYFNAIICCRTNATNISNASGLGFNFTFDFPALSANSIFKYNSSPVFPKEPLTYFCIGRPYSLNWNCIDADGDSLVYSLMRSTDGNSIVRPFGELTYAPGYNFNFNIMDGSPDITVNPQTGIINFIPTAAGNYFVAIKVDEYRNVGGLPIKIGTIYREVLLNTILCTFAPPIISTNKLKNRVVIDTVENVFDSVYTYQRNFLATDDITDSVFLKINPEASSYENVFLKGAQWGTPNALMNGAAGQNNIIGGIGTINGLFKWAIDSNMARALPYHFVVYSKDKTCDNVLSDSIDVFITVKLRGCGTIYQSYDVSGCDSALGKFGKWFHTTGTYVDTIIYLSNCRAIITHHVKINETHLNYKLIGCDFVIGVKNKKYYSSGVYLDTIMVNNCKNIHIQNVTILPSPPSHLLIGDSVISESKINQYSYLPIFGNITTWSVINGKILSSTNYLAIVEWDTLKNGSITAREKSPNGCFTDNTLQVKIFNVGMNSEKTNFSIYPNPTNGKIWVQYLGINNNILIDVFNVQGTLLKSLPLPESNELDLSDLSHGVYYIRIEGNAFKVVKY